MTSITILLADDHEFVRKGVRMVLAYIPDIEIVAEAVNGRQAIELARLLRPAVILMDIAMPQLDGIAATREILAFCPATKVVMLSAHGHAAYVARALAAGAVGFLHKQSSMRELRDALRTIADGGTFVSPMIAQANDAADAAEAILSEADCTGSALTSRECEVLQLITDGMGNRQTAAVLAISVKTIEKHRAHIMEKLNIHDIAGLTRFVLTSGIFKASPLPISMSALPEELPIPASPPGPLASVVGTNRPWSQVVVDRVHPPDRAPAPGAKSSLSTRLIASERAAVGLIGTPDDHQAYHRSHA
jgi:DNA-binding NarL/FixJ family response regulator